jgi:hypothetical protein
MKKKRSFSVRKLVVSEEQLQNARFAGISARARKILERSDLFYKDALLSSERSEYRKAAIGLARSSFTVK